jgi:hypothetical protein
LALLIRILIPILLVILVVAVVRFCINLYRLYKQGACKDCRYSGMQDEVLICWSPLFPENKTAALPVFHTCENVRGTEPCDFKKKVY